MKPILNIFIYTTLLTGFTLSCDNGNRPNNSSVDYSKAESQFASLMLQFKSVLIDNMISPQWTDIHEWEQACLSATSVREQAELLLIFEIGILWEGVSPNWYSRRASWISDVKNASSAFELGRLLAELETNVTWDSVDNSWREYREGWLKDATSL
ncbi:MAG: hypothetical protein MK207_07260 [Saprospiraceae bacterium]|nr:hypothetical protein [Saprospiraceae bacterium]